MSNYTSMKTKLFFSLIILSIISMGSGMKNTSFQLVKTNLHVTVLDGLGNKVDGATVTIYANSEDYKADRNAITKGETNKKGKFLFKGLETKTYYLDVRKGEMNNNGEGVQTRNPLAKGKVTKVTVVIE